MRYTERQIKLAAKNGRLAAIKNNMVEYEIAKKYSVGAQIAILRQMVEKPEEYATFTMYAEECKAAVKDYIAQALGVDYATLNI